MHGSPGVRSGLINGVVSVDILQKLSSEFRCEFLVSFASVFFCRSKSNKKPFFCRRLSKRRRAFFHHSPLYYLLEKVSLGFFVTPLQYSMTQRLPQFAQKPNEHHAADNQSNEQTAGSCIVLVDRWNAFNHRLCTHHCQR